MCGTGRQADGRGFLYCFFVSLFFNLSFSIFLQPSVYSQHVAIAVCRKPVNSLSSSSSKTSSSSTSSSSSVSATNTFHQCCLYLFPCGGSTKIIKPENVPFLLQPEKKVEEQQQQALETEENEEQKNELNKKDTIPIVVVVRGNITKNKWMTGFLELVDIKSYIESTSYV